MLVAFQHSVEFGGRLFLRSSFLNVAGEKGNGAGNYDGDSEPNDTFKRPTKTVLLPHGDQ